MRVLVVQNTVKKTIISNLNHIKDLLKDKKGQKIDFIVLPEMFMTPYDLKYFKLNQQTDQGQVVKFLSLLAKEYNAYIIGGSIPEVADHKIFNTSFIFNRQGKLINKYRKIHLFSVRYPNGKVFSEADVLSPGNQIITFKTEFGQMGLMICFDIRFPALAHKLRQANVKTIFVPAAFNTYTGPLHWSTTFRARAIDNQVFFVSASPARDSYGNYEPYGHSLGVDPYGKIIKELDEFEGLLDLKIDLDLISQVRASIPIIKNQIDISHFNVIK